MIYVGIDNGTSGAMAAICNDFKQPLIEVQPSFFTQAGNRKSLDADKNLDWLAGIMQNGTITVAFEQAQINPLFGAKGNYAAGAGNEFWRTLLTLSKISFTSVNPKTWQKIMFEGVRGAKKKKKDTKAIAAVIRRQRFPNLDTSMFNKAQVEGINDALCIALWAKQTL